MELRGGETSLCWEWVTMGPVRELTGDAWDAVFARAKGPAIARATARKVAERPRIRLMDTSFPRGLPQRNRAIAVVKRAQYAHFRGVRCTERGTREREY
jgi:hypothetical protein